MQEIFEALKCSTTIREGLEETLRDLRRHIAPYAPTFIIINDSEEKQVENKAIEEVERI
jgi:hypothetical protein